MKTVRIHCIKHVDFEGPGYIAQWAESNNCLITYTNLFKNEALPSPDDFDLLLLMGGPMSIYDESDFPWLIDEKSALKTYISHGKKILGICLGAQLIADALGARVYNNEVKEIGWFDVQVSEENNQAGIFSSIESILFKVFHWHGETFTLPEKSVLLASSEVCKNQAFIFENQLLALQFHLEVTPESVRKMIENGRTELVEGMRIQSEEEILSQTQFYESCNQQMNKILVEFTKNL
jgi:GMP synthase-like glutamine amidotransferase